MKAIDLIDLATKHGMSIGRVSAGHYRYTVCRSDKEIEEYQFIGTWNEFVKIITLLCKAM